MNIEVLESAKLDLLKGYEFYEFQEAGIGEYFLDSLYSDIDSLHFYAGIHPKNEVGFHYMFSKVFPFAIYYKVDEKSVWVYAILDCRANPKKLDDKLK